MKIMRGRFCLSDPQRLHAFCLYGNHTFLILELAFHQQKLLLHDSRVIIIESLRGDDGVGDARFIFEAEKHKTIRRSRTLPRDYGFGNSHVRPIAQMVKVGDTSNSLPFHLRTFIGHGMRTYGQSRAAKIRDKPPLGVHRGDGRNFRLRRE
jgi:hypothetical protein